MGFDCLRDLVNKNIKLRLCDLNSDSLVNEALSRLRSLKDNGQILRESMTIRNLRC